MTPAPSEPPVVASARGRARARARARTPEVSGTTPAPEVSGTPTPPPEVSGTPTELVVWEFKVRQHLVSRLIGRGGKFIKFLMMSSGAKILIYQLPNIREYQVCRIEGSDYQVHQALALIHENLSLKHLDLSNLCAPPSQC